MKQSAHKLPSIIIYVCIMFFMHSVHGQKHLFRKVEKAASDVVNAAWKAPAVSLDALISTSQTMKTANDQQINKPNQDTLIYTRTESISSIDNIFQTDNDLYMKINDFAANLGGRAEFVFDISAFMSQYLQNLDATRGHRFTNVLQAQNPFTITALPLAGAIQSARQRFYSISKPIPDDVRAALKGKFPDATLDRARYAIGKLEIFLPHMLNYLNTDLSNNLNHPATVDDIIVFRDEPGSFAANSCLWTHAVVHVDQYREYGVENFAWRNLNGSGIEEQTNRVASGLQGMTCNNGTSGALGFFGGNSTGQDFQKNHLPLLQADVPSEYFVAQCFFTDNTEPLYYFITNTGRIVTVNIYNGAYMPIGNATPPIDPVNYVWDFFTSQFRFAVGSDGLIILEQPRINPYTGDTMYNFGQPVIDSIIIGHVVRII